MKTSMSIIIVIICTVGLATQQSQAKKGCNAYGHACYGGHGKRSLTSNEQDEMHPNAIIQMYPNDEAALLNENDLTIPYPKYRLVKIMKSWFHGLPKKTLADLDYATSAENFQRDQNNPLN